MGARTHGFRTAGAAAAVLAGLWAPLPGQTASSGPAATATSQPGPLDIEPEPQLMPIPPAASVEEALKYTAREMKILDDANIRDGSVNTPALPVLLRRAHMLPTDRGMLTEADRPNLKNLWREPLQWRYRLVRVEGKFLALKDDFKVTPSPWWGTRAVYALWLAETQTGQNRRILVILTRKPAGKMRLGQRLQLAGIFYKLVRLPAPGDNAEAAELVDFPVLVAGAVFGPDAGGGLSGLPPEALAMFAVVLVLLVMFVFLRLRTRRRAKAPAGRYRPLRVKGAAAGEDETVDEELRRQVQAFQDRRRDYAGEENADHEENRR